MLGEYDRRVVARTRTPPTRAGQPGRTPPPSPRSAPACCRLGRSRTSPPAAPCTSTGSGGSCCPSLRRTLASRGARSPPPLPGDLLAGVRKMLRARPPRATGTGQLRTSWGSAPSAWSVCCCRRGQRYRGRGGRGADPREDHPELSGRVRRISGGQGTGTGTRRVLPARRGPGRGKRDESHGWEPWPGVTRRERARLLSHGLPHLPGTVADADPRHRKQRSQPESPDR